MNTFRQYCEIDTVLNMTKQGLMSDLDVSKSLNFAADDLSSKPGLIV